jgi:hypothetical protein
MTIPFLLKLKFTLKKTGTQKSKMLNKEIFTFQLLTLFIFLAFCQTSLVQITNTKIKEISR